MKATVDIIESGQGYRDKERRIVLRLLDGTWSATARIRESLIGIPDLKLDDELEVTFELKMASPAEPEPQVGAEST
jgi:hypothetical protein